MQPTSWAQQSRGERCCRTRDDEHGVLPGVLQDEIRGSPSFDGEPLICDSAVGLTGFESVSWTYFATALSSHPHGGWYSELHKRRDTPVARRGQESS